MQPIRKNRLQDIPAFLALLSTPTETEPVPKQEETRKAPEPESDVTVVNDIKSTDGHEWVDLGLPSGLKWATCNVGATKPEESGEYFAWGETMPKESYTDRAYQHKSTINWLGDIKTLSKYCESDHRVALELEDDAANVNWGGKWRMPTKAEFDELLKHCKWSWTTLGGKNGYKVTSKKNGNSIFFPAAGRRYGADNHNALSCGYYWSSSLSTGSPYYAWYLYFDSSTNSSSDYYRSDGFPIRPVIE
jgi:uncharacterized protein (TIGR02145 family)